MSRLNWRRLSTPAALLVGAAFLPSEIAWFAHRMARRDIGLDSTHAYWATWRHDLYSIPPGEFDAFNYSPAVAHALWPATALPWPAFLAGFLILIASTLCWLLWPLPPTWRWVLMAISTPLAIAVGNIEVLFAAVVALGATRPYLWAFPLLTKITPGIGVLWFISRGEWRRVAIVLAGTGTVAFASAATAPELWVRWLRFLLDTPVPATQNQYPPLWARVAVAVILVIWAARADRRWALPIAVALCLPLWSLGALFPLAALPRIIGRGDTTTAGQRPGPLHAAPTLTLCRVTPATPTRL